MEMHKRDFQEQVLPGRERCKKRFLMKLCCTLII